MTAAHATLDSRSGKSAALDAQGGAAPIVPLARRGLHLRTLVRLRWTTLGGQVAALLVAGLAFHLNLPIAACTLVMAVGAALNLGYTLASPFDRMTADWEAGLQLAFDILQLSVLLYLTGGVINPFSLLLVAHVTLAAATLPSRYVLALSVLTVACAAILGVAYLPLPWKPGEVYTQPAGYRFADVVAIASGALFCAGYAWRASRQSARMELALDVTRSVLAREQRLSALGGLAAAAAHELGTPLATIQVVAKEMAREAPPEMQEDARLLLSQAQRCRDILRRLTETPDTVDEVHGRMSLTQFLQEVIEPHAAGKVRVEALVSGAKDGKAPDLRRMPEVVHAMTSFVDNAVDFARSEVLVTARYDEASVAVEVRDDGRGFAAEVLTRLGQPYITSRTAAEPTRSGHTGMGLGFFIAKTLLERTGAMVTFRNGRGGGAMVSVKWPREAIEAPPVA